MSNSTTTAIMQITSNEKISSTTTTSSVAANSSGNTAGEIVDINIIKVDPVRRTRSIDKQAYLKLQKATFGGNTVVKRHSLPVTPPKPTRKDKYLVDEVDKLKIKYSPTSFGYSNVGHSELVKEKQTKDELHTSIESNLTIEEKKKSNIVDDEGNSSSTYDTISQEGTVVSSTSIDRIKTELDSFTMEEGKRKEKKRSNSIKKLFSGGFFGRNKKRKDKKNGENVVFNDNIQNESSYLTNQTSRQSTESSMSSPIHYQQHHHHHHQQQPQQNISKSNINDDSSLSDIDSIHNDNIKYVNVRKSYNYNNHPVNTNIKNSAIDSTNYDQLNLEQSNQQLEFLEKQYSQLYVNNFNQKRQLFEVKNEAPKEMTRTKPKISDYINSASSSNPSAAKYQSTNTASSSNSTHSSLNLMRERSFQDTPPRARDTYQSYNPINPKSINNSNNEHIVNGNYETVVSQKTIEQNLNSSISNKNFLEKKTTPVLVQDTYGIVFDNIEHRGSKNQVLSNNSPKLSSSLSSIVENTKLKLPPNREKFKLEPRLKSPISHQHTSTEKIIATELLKQSSSKINQNVINKPPQSPKVELKYLPSKDDVPDSMLRHRQMSLTSLTSVRSPIPLEPRRASQSKLSPQKNEIRRSIEEYYWKELKKVKDQQDYDLYMMMQSNQQEFESRLKRSRSLSPNSRRNSRFEYNYGRNVQPPAIPEHQSVDFARRKLLYEQNFVRNTPERRTTDVSSTSSNVNSIQRPIFRRGSLHQQQEMIYEANGNKKVSFSSQESDQQMWPTRKGYVQSPPQRRLDRIILNNKNTVVDGGDEYLAQQHLLRQQQQQQIQRQYLIQRQHYNSQNVFQYPQLETKSDPRHQPLPQQYQNYTNRSIMQPPRREIIINDEIYGQFGGYHNGSQLSLYQSTSGAPQSEAETGNIYNGYQSQMSQVIIPMARKQITVNNKFCDIYGQIHEHHYQNHTPQQQSSGVIMGQLVSQNIPTPQPPVFVRGTRLTSSVNDIGRYHHASGQQKMMNNDMHFHHSRPLPPIPNRAAGKVQSIAQFSQASDTESGSDVSEIQRIMDLRRIKSNKKQGFFNGM